LGNSSTPPSSFEDKFKSSWLFDELHRARNFGPMAHKLGTLFGGVYSSIERFIRPIARWTFKDPTPDYATLKEASKTEKIEYPKNLVNLIFFII